MSFAAATLQELKQGHAILSKKLLLDLFFDEMMVVAV